jgi:hypothetical protein
VTYGLAWVTTISMNLLTGTTTTWFYHATSNWWIYLSNATRTVQRLSRVNFAWFTITDVTEVGTLMNTTTQHLWALNQAEMLVMWIRTTFLDWTANLITSMFFARLILIANFNTSVSFCCLKLFK